MQKVLQIEKECEINLDWFYHACYYHKDDYESILSDGIKCNYLLDRPNAGKYNGPYYICLANITIPDNTTFLKYVGDNTPAFIVDGIKPIKCEKNEDYKKYIRTKDERRIGNYDGEYQYYYWIKREHIIGIVFNLYNYLSYENSPLSKEVNLERLLELCNLLKTLDIDIPILDYSRRKDIIAHEIDKEELKHYSKQLLL